MCHARSRRAAGIRAASACPAAPASSPCRAAPGAARRSPTATAPRSRRARSPGAGAGSAVASACWTWPPPLVVVERASPDPDGSSLIAGEVSGRSAAAVAVIRSRRLRARTRSSARLRAIIVSHPATEPRPASNRGASRHACANASSTTSSASARWPTIRYATAYSTVAVAIVELADRPLVAPRRAARRASPSSATAAAGPDQAWGIGSMTLLAWAWSLAEQERVYTPLWSVHKQPRSRQCLRRLARVNSRVVARPP